MARPKHEVLSEIRIVEAEIVKLDDLPTTITGISGSPRSLSSLRDYLRLRLDALRKEVHQEFGFRQGPDFIV